MENRSKLWITYDEILAKLKTCENWCDNPTRREKNLVVDALAKLSLTLRNRLWLNELPTVINNLVTRVDKHRSSYM
jgi:hypothetical protein